MSITEQHDLFGAIEPTLPDGFVMRPTALVQRSSTGHHSVFDGRLIWLLPSRLGNERISGVRKPAFG